MPVPCFGSANPTGPGSEGLLRAVLARDAKGPMPAPPADLRNQQSEQVLDVTRPTHMTLDTQLKRIKSHSTAQQPEKSGFCELTSQPKQVWPMS